MTNQIGDKESYERLEAALKLGNIQPIREKNLAICFEYADGSWTHFSNCTFTADGTHYIEETLMKHKDIKAGALVFWNGVVKFHKTRGEWIDELVERLRGVVCHDNFPEWMRNRAELEK